MPEPRLNRRQMLAGIAGLALPTLGRTAAQDDGPIRRGGIPYIALPGLPEDLGGDLDDTWSTLR